MQVKTQLDELQNYLTDASNMQGGYAEKLFIPETTGEIAEILKEANEKRIPVTISGVRTGTVGGAIPFGTGSAGRSICGNRSSEYCGEPKMPWRSKTTSSIGLSPAAMSAVQASTSRGDESWAKSGAVTSRCASRAGALVNSAGL